VDDLQLTLRRKTLQITGERYNALTRSAQPEVQGQTLRQFVTEKIF